MRVRFAVIGFCAVAAGCAPSPSTTSRETNSVSEALSKGNIKVLGALQYGQTSNLVSYTSPPKYSAFSFSANAGDAVDIWVRSPDHSGDAVALLLDSKYKEIAYNGNANRSTTDAHIVFTIPSGKGPTFYIAFREHDRQPARFSVQLLGPKGLSYSDTRISQADIDGGRYATDELNEIGDFLFNHVYTVDEGLGNALTSAPGGSGPRPNGRKIHNGKFGGPDAVGQACASCHTQIGDDGGGLNVSNIFQDGDGINVASALVRNPIALLGNGYVQELGNEMSAELQAARAAALAAAKAGNTPVTQHLTSKGTDFGALVAKPDGTVDTSGIVGVDADLVVKPFGWKGRVASLRRFVEGGFQVHFGMASDVLIAKNCAKPTPDVVGNGPDCHDPDGDGVVNEITEGQLTSMAIYATVRQAPIRIDPTDDDALARVQDGEQLFTQVSCASCHTPSMTLNNPIHNEAPDLTGGAPFQIDLTADVEDPKLCANDDGTVTVELFSDLKRHDLGAALYDPHPTFKTFAANVFLTPPLWGVSVTAPYLHDGRAATLADAIAAHDGEAATSRAAFQALSSDDQKKLIEFLGTLSRDPEHAN
jgi:hypothetical protein